MAAESALLSAGSLASKLPHAESLPDGFTDGVAEVAGTEEFQLPQAESLPEGFSEGSREPFVSHNAETVEVSGLLSHLGLGSPSRSGQAASVEEVASSEEQMGEFSVDLRAEKFRRFPVALSEANSSTSYFSSQSGSEQTVVAPPLVAPPLVNRSAGAGFEAASTEKRGGSASEASKTRKRRAKEIKALLNAADKSSEEKLQVIHAKYLQQVAETEQLEKELVFSRLKLLESSKEKEALSADMNKSVVLRQKLESLCRELQRQHKFLSEESKRIAEEEQQKRQELSKKFHTTITEVSAKLEEHEQERIRQMKENDMLHEKLKHFAEQYEVREEHYSHQIRAKSLEYQLLEVKLKQQQELCAKEEAKARMYSEQISQLLVTEQDLRSQLALYGDKFEQFQDTLTKSNEVFASFKQEMEKMSKTIKTLEKENFSLKKKTQKSDISMIELLDERSTLKKQLETTTNQKKKLEALCRSLQAERKQRMLSGSPQLSQEEDKDKAENQEEKADKEEERGT